MNKKDGFILLYSVVLISVVSILIGTIVSLAANTSVNNNGLAGQFEKRAAIDQIGEYFIVSPTADLTAAADGSYAAEINALAEKHGYTAESAHDGDIYTLTLKENEVVILYFKVTVSGGAKTYEWSYKAADAGEQGAA